MVEVMDRAAWLAERRKGIGSSDAPAVVGLSPWKQPLGVWMDKLGMLPDRPMPEYVQWGLRLEAAIAEAYAERTGRRVRKGDLIASPDHPFMLATLDYVADEDLPRIVELKTTSDFKKGEWGPDGSDEIPDTYLIQVTHQMVVAGVDQADLVVLIGGQKMQIHPISLNVNLAAILVQQEREFWENFVVPQIEPPADWPHSTTLELMNQLYPPTDKIITLDDGAVELVARYEQLAADASALTKDREQVKARLIQICGDAGLALLPDGREISRKIVTRAAHEVSESSYTDFRIRTTKTKKGKK